MVEWTFVFFVMTVICAILGFGYLAGIAAGIAQILCAVFLVLFAIGAIVTKIWKP